MKYTYHILTKKIPILNTNYLSMTGNEPEYDEIPVGGYFYPDDRKSQINLTSEHLIRECKDQINSGLVYLGNMFNLFPSPIEQQYISDELLGVDSNYIGKWSEAIDANANIYYVIVDNNIRKLIFSKPIEGGTITDIYGIVYIIEDDGKMVYCTPDEGDIMFDNIKEAKKYIKEKIEPLYHPIKKRNF